MSCKFPWSKTIAASIVAAALPFLACSGGASSGGEDVPPGRVDVQYADLGGASADVPLAPDADGAGAPDLPGEIPSVASDTPATGTGDDGGPSGCTWPVDWTCQDETARYRCADGAIVVEDCPAEAYCDDGVGACLPVCAKGTANCSGVLADGCNVDTTSDPLHCGDCPTSCGEAACDPAAGGWHYDAPDAPNKILLCPATCDAVAAAPTAAVDILLGCGRTALSTH